MFLLVAGLAWNYTEAIKTKNEIERERIASEERIEQARLEQNQQEAEIKMQTDREAQEAKIESDRLAAEAKAEAEARRAEQAAYDKKVEMYRQECKEDQEELGQQYTDFLNTCTRYNSEEYCFNSPAGKIFAQDLSITIQECIDWKMETKE